MNETNIAELPQLPHPGRTLVKRLLCAIGPLAILAGILVIAWPSAPSDCHGSPVCALDAFAELGKLLAGGFVVFLGIVWSLFAVMASRVRQPRQ
jgi:hypothetical protein